jgi:hypothetical protein
MGFTKRQAQVMGRGYSAVVERSKERQTLTLQLTWTGSPAPERVLETLRANLPYHLNFTDLKVEAAATRTQELERELSVSQEMLRVLREQVKALQMQQQAEAQPQAQPQPAQDTAREAISLREWARRLHKSYSWAWRERAAGRVEAVVIGGGKKHDQVLVYPDSWNAPAPKPRKGAKK